VIAQQTARKILDFRRPCPAPAIRTCGQQHRRRQRSGRRAIARLGQR